MHCGRQEHNHDRIPRRRQAATDLCVNRIKPSFLGRVEANIKVERQRPVWGFIDALGIRGWFSVRLKLGSLILVLPSCPHYPPRRRV